MDIQTKNWNIYSNGVRINKDPITDDILQTIKKQGYVSKVQSDGSVLTIPLNRTQIVQCIVL